MQDKQEKIGKGFSKTKKTLSDRIKELFVGNIDDDLFEELVECLVLSDVPFLTAEQIIDDAKEHLSKSQMGEIESVKDEVRKSALRLLAQSEVFGGIKLPALVLVSGVNGAGKTTSIAKLANLYRKQGKSILLAAADTFRAAASEQLSIWAERLDVPIIKSSEGQDPSSVVFDAIQSAHARDYDLVLCDTAGRLQNKKNLMQELEKIYRVCEKNKGNLNLYTLLVLDAMSGQNSINQLRSFSEVAKPDGIILTKTDGSSKGGVLLGIAAETDTPIWYVGTGEGLEDIAEFDSEAYVNAIL
ncbi:MAG: signal recognition particle-docking protein FtsY [Anaerofustis sp.]